MNAEVIQVMVNCCDQSIKGEIVFPEVVQQMRKIGVESYHVDLYRSEKTYYFPNGETYVKAMEIPKFSVAEHFSQANVIATIQSVQRQEVNYIPFLERIAAAGITHYYVYIHGRKAVYYSRTGDYHLEAFPDHF